MLMKLMKHELRGTARTMWPMYLAALVLSVFMALVVRFWDGADSMILNLLVALLMFLYVALLTALFIVVMVMMINRFKNNLLQDEGYVMFTLPVSNHQLIWSKIIVSCLWFVVTLLVVCLSVILVGAFGAYEAGMVGEILAQFKILWREFSLAFGISGPVIILEGIVYGFFSYASFCLLFYAALSTGHGFARHKGLMSVLFFGAYFIFIQVVNGLILWGVNLETFMEGMAVNYSMMASVHGFFLVNIGMTLLTGGIFYVVTTQMLRRRLNIE